MIAAVLEIYDLIREKNPDELHKKKEAIIAEYTAREGAISNVGTAIAKLHDDKEINLDLETLHREFREESQMLRFMISQKILQQKL